MQAGGVATYLASLFDVVYMPMQDIFCQFKIGFDFSTATALTDIYYLSCAHELHFKTRSIRKAAGYESSKASRYLVHEVCPLELLDEGGEYLGIAQWLYLARLPHIYKDKKDLSLWYLSRIVRSQV